MTCQKVDDEQEAEIRAAFDFFDHDGNGAISKTELAQAVLDLGLSDDALLNRLFTEMDKDNSGQIDWSEWAKVVGSAPIFTKPDGMSWQDVYRLFDPTLKGFISTMDLRMALGGTNTTEAQLRDIVRLVSGRSDVDNVNKEDIITEVDFIDFFESPS